MSEVNGVVEQVMGMYVLIPSTFFDYLCSPGDAISILRPPLELYRE